MRIPFLPRGGDRLIEALAAEYVLGTLRGGARQRLVRLAASDRRLQQAIRQWEARLTPLAQALPAQPPAERVWARIARQLGHDQPARASLWSSLALWRSLALGASTCALALAVTLAQLQMPLPAPRADLGTPLRQSGLNPAYIATLSAPGGDKPAVLVGMGRQSQQLWIKVADPRSLPAQGEGALQLWAVSADGQVRSLGVIAGMSSDAPRGEPRILTLPVGANADDTLAPIPALAMSLEPVGGSPTGQPTGPVLFKGPCIKMW